MSSDIAILWFDQDLRIKDNPALSAAIKIGRVLPIFIINPDSEYQLGAASRWWLHNSLQALDEALFSNLNYYMGDEAEGILSICKRLDVKRVLWNKHDEPWKVARDSDIKQQLLFNEIEYQEFNASLLHEPASILTKSATPYKVFTPYYNYAKTLEIRDIVTSSITSKQLLKDEQAVVLDTLQLLPKNSWHKKFESVWQPGEKGAHNALNAFVANKVNEYGEQRDFPDAKACSNLASHIHFGEISVAQIIDAIPEINENSESYIRQLYWREFSYYLLHYFPSMPTQNLKPQFNDFAWREDLEVIEKWQQGLTGYPFVDAGMRELWQTGYMHNRVRMISASFLVKNLLIDWRIGAKWFLDCLCDADLANNSASWQWVAGCGMDAAPFFRIFNPTTQAKKFDPDGEYIRRFVPELAQLPTKYLFEPWSAPKDVLHKANVQLGENYPYPIVDLKVSRDRALAENRRITKGKK